MSLTVLVRELRTLLALGCDRAGIHTQYRFLLGATYKTPSPVVLHVRESLTPGAEFERGTTLESFGVYQVDVITAPGYGLREATRALDLLAEVYTPGMKSTADGLRVAIQSASPLSLQQTPHLLTIPLSVSYRTYRNNPPKSLA